MESITSTPRQSSSLVTLNAVATPESLNQAQQNANKVYINIQALNKTYVTAIIDGRMFFKGMLDKDDVKSWEGDQYIKLKASAPRNILLYVNGENRGVMADQMTMLETTYFTKAIEDKRKTLESTAEETKATEATEQKIEQSQPEPAPEKSPAAVEATPSTSSGAL
jgi:hypothetical protein